MTSTFIAVSIVLIRERIQLKGQVWCINKNNEQGTLQFTNEIDRYDFYQCFKQPYEGYPNLMGAPSREGKRLVQAPTSSRRKK